MGKQKAAGCGIIPQYLGLNAYMDLHALQDFLKEDGLTTSVMLSMDEKDPSPACRRNRQSSSISNMDEKGERIRKLNEMMESFGSMIYLYSLIGIILGFSIIYISSIITTSERSRELASMMVLGMTPPEVLSVVTFEQWFISILGMAAGVPLAAVYVGISMAMSSDVLRYLLSSHLFISMAGGNGALYLDCPEIRRKSAA